LILARTSPQTPLGELTALPRPLAGFKGATSGEKGKKKKEGKVVKRAERKEK